jgi:hypothetical protein
MPSLPSPGFPQSQTNRTRDVALIEMTEYFAGANRSDLQGRAARCYDAAVREYNDIPWKFARTTLDIDLATPSPASSDTYDLTIDFRDPLKAFTVDSGGVERNPVVWVPYRRFRDNNPSLGQSVGGMPVYYTAYNVHALGRVQVWPKCIAPLTYPTLRLYCHRRIVFVGGAATAVLDCPQEVEEAIFDLALAMLTDKEEGFQVAAGRYRRAQARREAVMIEWRDFSHYLPAGGE